MAELIQAKIDWGAVPGLAEALEHAPKHLVREVGRAMNLIGRSDIEKLRREQLSGGEGRIKVSFKGLRNAFKHKAADSRKVADLNHLWLSEYTGWKMFRIFQVGGTIQPRTSRMLTVLTDFGRPAGRKRRWTQKQMKAALKSGELKVLRTRGGPVIVQDKELKTKKGKLRKGSRMEIVAYLVPKTRQKKRLDFFANFEANKAEHERLLAAAAQMAMEKAAGQVKK